MKNKKDMKKKYIIGAVALILIIGIGAYYLSNDFKEKVNNLVSDASDVINGTNIEETSSSGSFDANKFSGDTYVENGYLINGTFSPKDSDSFNTGKITFDYIYTGFAETDIDNVGSFYARILDDSGKELAFIAYGNYIEGGYFSSTAKAGDPLDALNLQEGFNLRRTLSEGHYESVKTYILQTDLVGSCNSYMNEDTEIVCIPKSEQVKVGTHKIVFEINSNSFKIFRDGKEYNSITFSTPITNGHLQLKAYNDNVCKIDNLEVQKQ